MNLAGDLKKVNNQPFDIKCSAEIELENTNIFVFFNFACQSSVYKHGGYGTL